MKTKEELALDRYGRSYDNLCWARRDIIDGLFRTMQEEEEKKKKRASRFVFQAILGNK